MTKSFLSSKRGNYGLDIMFFLLILFMLAIVGIILYPVLTGLNDELQDDPDIPAEYKTVPDNFTDKYPVWLDQMFLFLFVIATLAMWASAWFIDVYPIFFIISLVLLVFITIGGMMLANSYTEAMSNSALSSTAELFTILPFIMGNLGIITITIGTITAVLLFSKLRNVV